MTNRSRLILPGLLSLCGALALLSPSERAPQPAAPDATSQKTARPRITVSAASSTALTPEREQAILAQQDRIVAYRDDQVLVSLAPGADLDAIATAHGLTIHRQASRSGYGSLGVPAGHAIGEVMGQLRADPDVTAVAPNGIVRGASSAADLQEDADKDHAKAAELEASAQAAEAWLEEVIASGAGEETIEDAQKDADEAREKADKAHAEAVRSQEKADHRVDLEYRAKVREAQLHMKTSHHPKFDQSFERWDEVIEPSYAEIVVAVLDTGVAYADTVEDGVAHVQAPSLSGSAIVAPYDFVNDDEGALDDHQHGTHIASIIASDGALVGMAPGVSLMPVKVLDENNSGTEIDLVNGIHHAVDSGADVINMSLSFGAGYVPSPLLREALERAHDAGIILIAAAGNAAQGQVSWPAASHRVVAVGSAGINEKRALEWAEYANHSTEIDLTATGGIVGVDRDGDGFDDGILSETINPGDPGSTGYWFYAGTSQAAAVVSGAVVRMLSLGIPASDAVRMLEYTSEDELDGDRYLSGWGAGNLDLGDAEHAADNSGDREKVASPGEMHVSVHPYVISKSDGEKKEAHAIFSVVDEVGAPVGGMTIIGRITGSQSEIFECKTDGDGLCEYKLDTIETKNEDDEAMDPGLVWVWSVDGLLDSENLVTRPSGLLYASDGLEIIAAAIADDPVMSSAALAIYWPESEDEELGDLAESYTVLSGGTGIATSPMGISFTPAALGGLGMVSSADIDLDGTGIATSPMGVLQARIVTFDGTGIATSPMGLRLPPLMALDGTGIATSPIGIHPLNFTQVFDGSGIATSPMGYRDNPILMSSSTIIGASAEGHLAAHLDAGGWAGQDGYAPTALLAGSSLVSAVSGESGPEGSSVSDAVTGTSTGRGGYASPGEIDAQPVPALIVE